MNKLRIAALAAGFLLQSLAYPADAPLHVQNDDRHAFSRVAESRDSFPLPDAADLHGQECDPEDDCPRPPAQM
jgi:hypothetical protein